MEKRNFLLLLAIAVLVCNGAFLFFHTKDDAPVVKNEEKTELVLPPPVEEKPQLKNIVPEKELTYDEIQQWLEDWHKAKPEITEIGVVGKCDNGKEIKYIRIGNKTGPKVLIMGGIHGNEKLCSMTVMGIIGTMLRSTEEDISSDKISKLLENRDVYFVPVLSVTGYDNNSRYVKGVDPNRVFSKSNLRRNSRSIACVAAIKEFYEKNKFKAVMSCHSYGRLYFYPWGYTKKKTGIDGEYNNLVLDMSRLSGYSYHQLYRRSVPPYYGYELDWFHSQGSVAIVNEIGTKFQATKEEIAKEVQNNMASTTLFIEKAPTIEWKK